MMTINIIGKNTQIMLEQEEDCCGRTTTDTQFLKAESLDGGGGDYVVLETERWAISSKADGHALIDQICNELGVE